MSAPALRAEVLAIGTELLLGQTLDTHSGVLGRVFAECGLTHVRRTVVGDNLDRIVEALREALERADVVVTVGGLGPTTDDLTREAIAATFDRPLEEDAETLARLQAFFAARGLRWNELQRRQALRPVGAELIDNPVGTAPGLMLQAQGKTVIAMPGPRGEFRRMLEGPVGERLQSLGGGAAIVSRVLKVCGIGEGDLVARLGALLERENPTLAPCAHPGEVHLRLTARAGSPRETGAMLDAFEAEVRELLGEAIFGRDEETLEEAVVALLKRHAATLSVAESLTGGGLAARLTAVPGVSETFVGGMVTYQLASKAELLGIPEDFLNAHGPVSPEVAIRMAEGVRERLRTDYGISLTGNAGPTPDVDGKPVGLVYVGFAGPGGVFAERCLFSGDRADVRRRATQAALRGIREILLKL